MRNRAPFRFPRAWISAPALAFFALGISPRIAPAQTGTISGTVVLAPSMEHSQVRFRPYGAPGMSAVAPEPASDTAGPMAVVVYLDSLPGTVEEKAAPDRFVMYQRGQSFDPRLLPVPIGSTVDFENDDPIFHNVFSLSARKTFDLGRYPEGESKSVTFDQAGVVPVFCHIHSDMRSIILVLDTPWFTKPDASGHFTLTGVRPGDYRIVAWHDRVPPQHQHVRVTAGGTTEVRFTIPILEGGAS